LPEHIDVRVAGDWLVVRGERQSGAIDGTARHRERVYGAFEKRIALPSNARRDAIDATLHDGVLVVTIPAEARTMDGREMRVDVKSGDLK
jgi:HSP20 family protein